MNFPDEVKPSRCCKVGMRVRRKNGSTVPGSFREQNGTVVGDPYRRPGRTYYVPVKWDGETRPKDVFISHLRRIDDEGNEIAWNAPWGDEEVA